MEGARLQGDCRVGNLRFQSIKNELINKSPVLNGTKESKCSSSLLCRGEFYRMRFRTFAFRAVWKDVPCECMAQPVKGTPPEVACALRKHAGSFSAPRKLTFAPRISALRCRSSSVPSKHSCPSHTHTQPRSDTEKNRRWSTHMQTLDSKCLLPKAVLKINK